VIELLAALTLAISFEQLYLNSIPVVPSKRSLQFFDQKFFLAMAGVRPGSHLPSARIFSFVFPENGLRVCALTGRTDVPNIARSSEHRPFDLPI